MTTSMQVPALRLEKQPEGRREPAEHYASIALIFQGAKKNPYQINYSLPFLFFTSMLPHSMFPTSPREFATYTHMTNLQLERN
jgi:hypothetical protein